MSNSYPTKQDLADYLKQPGRLKATGALGDIDTGGRCCLGHYCDLAGIPYDPDFASIESDDFDRRLPPGQPVLPRDHWLFAEPTRAESEAAGDNCSGHYSAHRVRLQNLLTNVNDDVKTVAAGGTASTDFSAVIKVLEA